MSAEKSLDDQRRWRQQTSVLSTHEQMSLNQAFLNMVQGADHVQRFELSANQLCKIGSSPECGVSIDDDTVSWEHCEIDTNEQGFLIRDLDSTNGTYVDNYKVREVFLRPGALIRIGNVVLRFEMSVHSSSFEPEEDALGDTLLARSPRMLEVFAAARMVGNSEATILIQGETGTGKSAIARAIHESSPRKNGPFVVLDCASSVASLLESELFGHEKGAFTGAIKERKGAFETAEGGTLFIDELSDLAPELQPKLLRALEEREYRRVGSMQPRRIDCRVIAATQKNLWEAVESGEFRQDLYFRLAVVTIPMPSLRERREDIPLLVERFLRETGEQGPSRFDELTPEVQQELLNHPWPGNIRELRNYVARLSVMQGANPNWSWLKSNVAANAPSGVGSSSAGSSLSAPQGAANDLPINFELPFKEAKDALVSVFERMYLDKLLERCNKNIAQAAREAGINRRHLYTLLEKHGLHSK